MKFYYYSVKYLWLIFFKSCLRRAYVNLIYSKPYWLYTKETLNNISLNWTARNWSSWRKSEPDIFRPEMRESRQENQRKETKRNLSTLKESQENAINGKRKKNAQEKTHDVSVTMRINVANQRDRFLLLQSRRRKTMDKFFDKKNSQRSEYIWEEIWKTAQRLHQWEMYEHLVSLLTSSGVSKLQTEMEMQIRWKVRFYAQRE